MPTPLSHRDGLCLQKCANLSQTQLWLLVSQPGACQKKHGPAVPMHISPTLPTQHPVRSTKEAFTAADDQFAQRLHGCS